MKSLPIEVTVTLDGRVLVRQGGNTVEIIDAAMMAMFLDLLREAMAVQERMEK